MKTECFREISGIFFSKGNSLQFVGIVKGCIASQKRKSEKIKANQ